MNSGNSSPRRPSPAAFPSSDPNTSTAHSSGDKNDRSYMTILLANNIHCASCVAYATEVLSFIPFIWGIDISIITHEIRVRHSSGTSSTSLLRALVNAAFEIYHVTAFDERGVKTIDIETSPSGSGMMGSSSRLSQTFGDSTMKSASKASRRRMHIENCDACKQEEQDSSIHGFQLRDYKGAKKKRHYNGRKSLYSPRSQDSDPELLKEKEPAPSMSSPTTSGSLESELTSALARTSRVPGVARESKETPLADEYEARISIVGMTCASCVNAITSEVQQLNCVKSITVNLLTNSANLTYLGPRENIDVVISQIEDVGFEASIDDVVSKSQPAATPASSRYVANISISGMTCGACVGVVTRGIEELPFIADVVVDLLGNNGRVEFDGEENLDEIVVQIEDLGFEATVIDCNPLFDDASAPAARTVMVQVDGMFCHHCPDRIIHSLEDIPGQPLTIEENLSLKNPIVKMTYTPHPPEFTVRTIISKIESTNDAFSAHVYHPPSIEDRSRAMQLKERRRLLLRLLFTFLAAIPTFMIGIVWMTLVPSTDKIRVYLEEPMWVGTVARMEWALLILTTPVMIYGTDVFHRRAIKEIRALWRPSSKVPILRRFYRFGSMNLLISAGTSVAYFSSLAVMIIGALSDKSKASHTHTPTYFDSVVFLTFFILIGRSIEAYSKAKTGDAVSMLGKLRPSEALLVVGSSASMSNSEESVDEKQHVPSAGRIERVHVDLLEPGDTVSVPHGASPPADGYVADGNESYQFDESSLTGESKPVKKFAGDKVYAGSVNVGKPVHVKVSEVGSTSMLEQIVAVVREGQTKRAPVERVADIVTGYFVPAITFIAITTFVIWFALGQSGALPSDYLDMPQGGWAFWSLEFAIAVFVVACPCGLALAAPTALFVGGGLAAKHGILVRGGGEAFQEASRLDAIVFDKTGTLTEGGSLKVSDHEVLLVDSELRHAAWAVGKALEESSNHPIAQAIAGFCDNMPSTASIVSSSNITEISGQGMKGTFTVSIGSTADEKFNNMRFEAAIGNERLLRSIGSADPNSYYLSNLLARYQSAGKSTAILSLRKLPDTASATDSSLPPFSPTVVFATSDPIRSETVSVISELQSRNVEVYMCTGDNARTAQAVASTVGIPAPNIMANVLPNQKADYIRQIQQSPPNNNENNPKTKKKRIIAFAGDGTNDSPALTASDVSIAMASGSDVAVSSASFILLTSDLSKIPELVKLSRRVFRRVKMNFVWAAVYNVLLVPVAAGVFYPIVTGRGDAGGGAGRGGGAETHWRLGPVWASAAMALSSVSVVCSSLALRFEWSSFVARVKSMGKRRS